MTLEGPAGLRKILHLSQFDDRGDLDPALNGLAFAHEQAMVMRSNAKFVTLGNTLLCTQVEVETLPENPPCPHVHIVGGAGSKTGKRLSSAASKLVLA
jgi:hypothetical protein